MSCAVDYVAETPSSKGPIYSARLQCSNKAGQSPKKVANLIIRPLAVKNFINNTHFFEWDEATHAAYFKRLPDAVEITVPKLPEMAAEQVDLASVPFVTFTANKKQSGDSASYSFVLRGYIRHWLGNVWAEYDRINLTDIVAARAPAAAVHKLFPHSGRTET